MTAVITLLVAVSILSSVSSSVRNSRFGYGMGPFSKILQRNKIIGQINDRAIYVSP